MPLRLRQCPKAFAQSGSHRFLDLPHSIAKTVAIVPLLLLGCGGADIALVDAPESIVATARGNVAAAARELAATPPENRVEMALDAHSPRIVEKRAGLKIALQRDEVASAAFDIDLDSGLLTSRDGEHRASVELGFDLVRLLGVGRARATEITAHADALLAAAELRRERFLATIRVRRALLLIEAFEELDVALVEYATELRPALARTRQLARMGWLGEADASEAITVASAIERERAVAIRQVDDLRDEVAVETGFVCDPAEGLVAPRPPRLEPEGVHPEIAVRITELGVAEARLRLAAAERWPELRMGPSAEFDVDATFLGSILSLRIEDWRRVDSAIRSRTIERDAIRTKLDQTIGEIDRKRGLDALRLERALLAQDAATTGCQASSRAEVAARSRYFADPGRASDWLRMASECVKALVERNSSERAVIEARVEVEFSAPSPNDAEGSKP